MGIFSSIIENIKDTVSYMTDITFDIIGNTIDYLKGAEQQISSPIGGGGYDYEPDDSYLYDDYIDWIQEAWY